MIQSELLRDGVMCIGGGFACKVSVLLFLLWLHQPRAFILPAALELTFRITKLKVPFSIMLLYTTCL